MDQTETVAIIRSLLASSKTPIIINALNSEFRSVTGFDIPLFEHASLYDFMCSLSDTFTLSGIPPNLSVSLIKNHKSDHIISMVEKQKSPLQRGSGKVCLTPQKVNYSQRLYKEKLSDKHLEKTRLYEHLLMSHNGLAWDEVKALLPQVVNQSIQFKQYNLINFIKSHPYCMYFKGKFYAVDIIKKKLLNAGAF